MKPELKSERQNIGVRADMHRKARIGAAEMGTTIQEWVERAIQNQFKWDRAALRPRTGLPK